MTGYEEEIDPLFLYNNYHEYESLKEAARFYIGPESEKLSEKQIIKKLEDKGNEVIQFEGQGRGKNEKDKN